MKPCIQSKNTIPSSVNFFAAARQGFSEIELECALFNDIEELDTSLRCDIVVCGLGASSGRGKVG